MTMARHTAGIARGRRPCRAILGLLALLWGISSTHPAPAQVPLAPPLAQELLLAATQRTLVEEQDGALITALASAGRVNAARTIWTLELHPDVDLSAYEVAARLRQAIRRDPIAQIIFRHVLSQPTGGASDAAGRNRGWDSGQRDPIGILPIGPHRIRFLLDRPDPAFAQRLAAPEAALCTNPWSGTDPGCGPYRLTTRFWSPQRAIARLFAQAGFPDAWLLLDPASPENGSAPLMHIAGVSTTPAPLVEASFWLPALPRFCASGDPLPATSRSPFLAHLFLETAPHCRAIAAPLRRALQRAPLLPTAERLGWVATGRFLPGRQLDLPAHHRPPTPAAATTPRTARLLYPEAVAAGRCVAERVRALLLAHGWDVQPVPLGWEALQSAHSSGAFDLMLHVGVTRRGAHCWNHLRLLAPWIGIAPPSGARRASAYETGPENVEEADALWEAGAALEAEEWIITQRLEATLLEQGVLVPLLTAPIGWRLKAPSAPRALCSGILPIWEEPRPAFVVTVPRDSLCVGPTVGNRVGEE